MSEVTYVSNVKIEHVEGKLRQAYLPAEAGPVKFSVHGAIAEHYGVSSEITDPHASTIDYVVAAAGG
jgi:hypothetical protein